MTKPILRLLFVLLICLITNVQAQDNKLVFSPHWMPQAQFAGYYIALDQGFYKEAGLDVEIIHPNASVNALNFLKEGKADIISLFLVTGLHAALNEVDLVNIAQISQHSAIMFVTKKSSGIDEPDKLRGKRIGVWKSGFKEVPMAMLSERQIDVEWVPILSSVNMFLLGGIDAMTVMWFNEYHQIYLCGIDENELNTFFMSDYGYDIPEDGLYVMRPTFAKRSDDLRAFVEATLRGWQFASENRDYTVNLVVEKMLKANIPTNKAHQQWMLDKVIETQQLNEKNLQAGKLLRSDFDKTLNILRLMEKNNDTIYFGDFYKTVMQPKTNQ